MWTKRKDLVERVRVKISKRRGNRQSEVPKKERGMEFGTQVEGQLESEEMCSPVLPVGGDYTGKQ